MSLLCEDLFEEQERLLRRAVDRWAGASPGCFEEEAAAVEPHLQTLDV